MVTLCLPFHLSHTINNCTLSLQHQRSYLFFTSAYIHIPTQSCTHLLCVLTCIQTPLCSLPLVICSLILIKMDQLNLNIFSQKSLSESELVFCSCCIRNCSFVISLTPTNAALPWKKYGNNIL